MTREFENKSFNKGLESMFCKSGRDAIYYEVWGDVQAKTPVVFLHSLGVDHRLWKFQLEFCRKKEIPAVLIDARGHGQSTCSEGVRVEYWVQDIANILAKIQTEKVILCGISMGGVQALAFTNLHAEKVGGLILADTFNEIAEKERALKISQTAGIVVDLPMASFAESYLDVTLSDSVTARAVRGDLFAAIASLDQGAYSASATTCFSVSLFPSFNNASVPTLILIGEDDQKTPLHYSKTLQDLIPGSELRQISAAKHLSNVDNPEVFNQELSRFFQRLGVMRN